MEEKNTVQGPVFGGGTAASWHLEFKKAQAAGGVRNPLHEALESHCQRSHPQHTFKAPLYYFDSHGESWGLSFVLGADLHRITVPRIPHEC